MSLTGDPLPVGVCDDSGYEVTDRDLVFLGISGDQFLQWTHRTNPLGFSQSTFDAFALYLGQALHDDDIPLEEADVRLKGSAAAFFSGRHKEIPWTRDELVAAFRGLRGRLPEVFEVLEIERKLHAAWPDEAARPLRRPFDSLYTVGLERVPSDFDLQVSSDLVVERCEEAAGRLGIVVTRETTIHNVYDFVRKDLVRSVMPALTAFTVLMGDALQREVSIAVFPSAGPPDRSDTVGELSAHFRPTDWILHLEAIDDKAGA